MPFLLRGYRHCLSGSWLLSSYQCPRSVKELCPLSSFAPAITTTRLQNKSQKRLCSQHNKPSTTTLSVPRQHSFHSTPQSRAQEEDSKSLSSEKTKSTTTMSNDTYSVIFEKNSKWRRDLSESHPDIFANLGKGQSPQILWIGCADSRCPETTVLGLQPGEVFCHRNIANILVPTDLNSLSVIQYAVQYLKVKHIIVCGHTSCGGVAAALDNKALGLIDTWLQPLRAIRQANSKVLSELSPTEAGLKLVDLNVRNSVNTLLQNPVVIDAMLERGLQLHGLIFNVGTGELDELDIKEDDELVDSRQSAFKTS